MIGILVLVLFLGLLIFFRPDVDWSTKLMIGMLGLGVLSLFTVALTLLGFLGIVFSGLIVWHFNRKMLRGPYASR